MAGIKLAKNSRNKNGKYVEICKPYIAQVEKMYKKNPAYPFSYTRHASDVQLESDHRSHLWRLYWYTYIQYKSSRKRKQCIRKMFKYWYGCPDAYGEYSKGFWDYDVISPWPMFATTKIRSVTGDPIVFPKIKNIMMHNAKALYISQFGELFATCVNNAK